MTVFKEGDLVEARKGTRVIRDVLHTGNPPLFHGLYLGSPSVLGLSSLDGYREAGFSLELIERPEPKAQLPTEPGVYGDRYGEIWRLDNHGDWFCLENGYRGIPSVKYRAPLTRLGSRADTAKEVIDAVTDDFMPGLGSYWLEHLTAIREQFGVTE